MTDPKPCPFCGGTSVGIEEGSTFHRCRVVCRECLANGPEVRRRTLDLSPENAKRAIEAWNERAPA